VTAATATLHAERLVAVADLGEQLAALRLGDASALRAMRASIAQYGQLSPVRAFERGGSLQLLDGFKRLRAARGLGLRALRALVVDVDVVEATVHMRELHVGCVLTVIEEAWIVRALHREHRLSQGEIAARLRCHKSWVCRRLILVEALDPTVQADVRLGLLAARAAVHVAALPRGNQAMAAKVAIGRGLTVRQTDAFVRELVAADDHRAAQAVVTRWSEGRSATAPPGVRACHNVADRIARDITTIQSTAGRLQSCLITTPLAALEPSASNVLRTSLGELATVLRALTATVADTLSTSPSTSLSTTPSVIA
jgi:ParB-like chromosome segregation protein Spo0J